MSEYRHFTNRELIANLSTRDDLTDLEHELLDRFTRALDAAHELEGVRHHDVRRQLYDTRG